MIGRSTYGEEMEGEDFIGQHMDKKWKGEDFIGQHMDKKWKGKISLVNIWTRNGNGKQTFESEVAPTRQPVYNHSG